MPILLGPYVKTSGIQCYPREEMYHNLEEAKSACDGDDSCIEINDNNCKGNVYQLCRVGSKELPSSVGSCIYKRKGKYDTSK